MSDSIDIKKAIQVRIAAPKGDLADELARANDTLQTLRIELRTAIVKYRMWRAHMRCGRSVDAAKDISNLQMTKRIKGLWATYRFAQMVRADINHMMALETETRERLGELHNIAVNNFDPKHITYDELEKRYGSAAAQQIYDDMLIATARDVARRKIVR
jgi:hypothetical protein